MATVSEDLKYRGNVNRIMEMHELGNGPNAISGVFADHGMTVTPQQVKGIIESREELCRKALPKSAVKNLTDANGLLLT
jgi:hypothetical protein